MSKQTSRTLLAIAALAIAPLALEAQKASRPIDTRGLMTPEVSSGFGASSRAPNIKPVSIGTRHSSSLDDSDDGLDNGKKIELWAMQLRSGETVIATARSGAFDTQMAVFDPENTSNSAENDDYEQGSTNSQVTFRAGKDGVFGIIVTSYDPSGRGAYTLEVIRSGDDENTLALAPLAVKRIPLAKVAR